MATELELYIAMEGRSQQRGGGDLVAIQAQFDAKFRLHMSSLDQAFANNIQWIEDTLDDGLKQLGAKPRAKRKHPEVPLFEDNTRGGKENARAAKSQGDSQRHTTRGSLMLCGVRGQLKANQGGRLEPRLSL